MALEYLPLSLHDLIRAEGRMPIDRAVVIAHGVALGLAAVHERGIVHRDIKPQNILTDQSGMAKVTDFGIGRAVDLATMTSTGAIMGTPHYMSPEQAKGLRVDIRSDLYSLGIALYDLESDSLTVRAVDKYGNESPDSNPIVVPPAQGCDSEEPVPEAPEGEPTEVGAVPLPTPAEEWAIYEASTDFSAMGLFVNDVGTVAERKACSLRGGAPCTDTSPTLSEINLDMVLGPFPSREEAIQGFCDNIVPDSAYSVRGFRKAKLLFDGEGHYIFNGPVC